MSYDPPPDAERLLQHASFVRAVARATLHGDDLVDDVVQETWLAALRDGTRRRGPLAPWLAGVARHQARNLLRKRSVDRRRERHVARAERVSPQQDVVDRLEIERRLIHAVACLPEHYRTPLVLRYLDGLPPRAIALRLDMPVDTVRTRVRRGLARLRDHLEADHGKEARDWRLALLPLLPRESAPSTALVHGAGGLLMGKKLVLALIALILLLGGVVWILPGLVRPTAEGRPEEVAGLPDHPEPVPPAPALIGRPEDARLGESEEQEPDRVGVPNPRAQPAKAGSGEAAADALRALIADIRRDVEPAWWAGHTEVATLEGRNGVVIARAPPAVLDALTRYLEALRKGEPHHVAESKPLEDRSVQAARAALRPLLRGVLEREQKLRRAMAAWRQGDLAEAESMAKEVLADEPDNAHAQLIAIRAARTTGKQAAEDDELLEAFESTRQRLREGRRQPTLAAWLMHWPSVGTWEAIQGTLMKAGTGTFRKLAPDLATLLDRGNVTLDVADEPLQDTVRRLQIESLADIRLSRGAVDDAARVRVQDLREETRSLREILEALVARLPEGWAWSTARDQVVLTLSAGDGEVELDLRLRYFDVKDLIAPGYTPPAAAPAPTPSAPPDPSAPPAPPVYRPNPEGGPPIRVR